jgi:predicted DNA-binding protein YlxM (UPF0122 family)
MKSQLSDLFDLFTIDWVLCDQQAQKKIMVEISKLYNEGLSMHEIVKTTNYDKRAIQRWLRLAKQIGLCEYDAKELRNRDKIYIINSTKLMEGGVFDEYIRSDSLSNKASSRLGR